MSNCLQLSQAEHCCSEPRVLGPRVNYSEHCCSEPLLLGFHYQISCFFFALFLSTSQGCEKRSSSQNKVCFIFLSWACSLACMLACFPVLGWHLKDGRVLSVRVQKLHIEKQEALGGEAAPPDCMWTLLVQARVVFLDLAFQAVLPPAGWDVLSSSQHIHTKLTPSWLTLLRSRWEMHLELSEDKIMTNVV